LHRYIGDKLYWGLHAPRQTGKTTFLQSWMQEINVGDGPGCGGIFLYCDPSRRREIQDNAFANPGISLLPGSPRFAFDQDYLLFALGVLSARYPDAVFPFMKEHIIFE
jgi:hypothetical protein